MHFKPYTEKNKKKIWNLFDFRSDPDPDPELDPLSRKRIKIHIKMKRIRNTELDNFKELKKN